MSQRNDGGWCECSAQGGGCGRRFGGLTGFDAHRIMLRGGEFDWRCATDAELAAKGYFQDAHGWWRKDSPDTRFTPPISTRIVATAPSREEGAA